MKKRPPQVEISKWLHDNARDIAKSGAKTSVGYVLEKAFAEYYELKSPNLRA